MKTDTVLRAFALAAVLGLVAGAARGADEALELTFKQDAGGGGVFSVAGQLEAPRGALVMIGLAFDGQPVHGAWRRVEVGQDGVVRMTWLSRARVVAGEYEAVATLDSSRQPRTLRAALPGAARSLRATAYVGEPTADVAEEELARRTLLADASAVASLSRECVEAAPITTASDALARSSRRALLSRVEAQLDEVERRVSTSLPPAVFAARLPDLHETLAMTIRTFRESLRVEAWHDVDCGMEPPAFLDRSKRPQPPFVTLREVSIEATRVQAELEASRAGRARGPRSLDRLVRQTSLLVADLARGEAAVTDDERRARRARRARLQTLARELAADPVASSIAGGGEALRALAVDLEELAATPDDKRPTKRRGVDAHLAAIEVRVTEERARRRAEIDALARSAQKLQEDLKRLPRDERAADEHAAWRRSVQDLRGTIAALPDRGNEFFPGVRGQLELVTRALLARETAEGLRVVYLETVIRQALEKVRSAAPPG